MSIFWQIKWNELVNKRMQEENLRLSLDQKEPGKSPVHYGVPSQDQTGAVDAAQPPDQDCTQGPNLNKVGAEAFEKARVDAAAKLQYDWGDTAYQGTACSCPVENAQDLREWNGRCVVCGKPVAGTLHESAVEWAPVVTEWARRQNELRKKREAAEQAKFVQNMKDAAENHKKLLGKGAGDPVNHPSHYTKGKYEVIDVLLDWFKNEPLAWQVGKYIARFRHKNNPLEDLKKARFYLDRLIKQVEEESALVGPDNEAGAVSGGALEHRGSVGASASNRAMLDRARSTSERCKAAFRWARENWQIVHHVGTGQSPCDWRKANELSASLDAWADACGYHRAGNRPVGNSEKG